MHSPVLYDYAPSANCLKVRILLAHLGLDYRRTAIDIFGGDTLTPEFLRLNPARQVPVLESGPSLIVESGAIMWYLASGTSYLSGDRAAQAAVVRWLVFENGPIGAIATLRFRMAAGLLQRAGEGDALRALAEGALAIVEAHLDGQRFLAANSYSIADIACYGYVHVAHEAGIEMDQYPSIGRWIAEVEAQPGFVNDLVPLPASARPGRGLSIYG